MYLRLVQAKFQPDLVAEIKYHYEKEILPVLEKTQGCLYAAVVQSTRHNDEGISLTLWTSEADAKAYERSGTFGKLLDVLRPYFSGLSEWRLTLSEDLQIEYTPVSSEPQVRSYVSALETSDSLPRVSGLENLHLRVVSITVQEGKIDLFRSLYNDHILPVLRHFPGCMVVQLAQSVLHAQEFISVTVWNTRLAAQNYEEGGAFERLKQVLKPALSGLSQWSLDTERNPNLAAATAQDLEVETYTIVAGRALSRQR